MKRKYIFVIMLLLLFFQKISSEANQKPFKKFCIAIGGGLNYSFSIERIAYGAGNNINILIPFSFTYYPKSFFGIGFTYNPGINFLFAGKTFTTPLFIDFTNNFNILNKFGNIDKLYFLMEYGISLIGRFSLSDLLNEYKDYNMYHKNHLLCGPNLLVGFELKTKNKFLFTFGGIVEFLFGSIDIYSYETTSYENLFRKITVSDENWTKYFEYDISFGIECRWRFFYEQL